MKRVFLLLPLSAALVGCSTRAQTDPTIATGDTPTTSAAPATSEATPAPKKYQAVDLVSQMAGQPPAVIAGLKKAALPAPPLSIKVPDKARVEMDTTKGPIILELNGKEAPMHVRSFLYLTGHKFYDGTIFHRHADLLGNGKGFIIQGGDPLSKDPATAPNAGIGGPAYEVPREHNSLKHDKLVIAAARTQDPDSAGSQFYITQGETYFLDNGDGYTVFGKVVSGDKAALALTQGDKIKSVKILK